LTSSVTSGGIVISLFPTCDKEALDVWKAAFCPENPAAAAEDAEVDATPFRAKDAMGAALGPKKPRHDIDAKPEARFGNVQGLAAVFGARNAMVFGYLNSTRETWWSTRKRA
jgi:hypothetical protein